MQITIKHIESINRTIAETSVLLQTIGYELGKMLDHLKSLEARKKNGGVRVEIRGRISAGPTTGRCDHGIRAMPPEGMPPLYEARDGSDDTGRRRKGRKARKD